VIHRACLVISIMFYSLSVAGSTTLNLKESAMITGDAVLLRDIVETPLDAVTGALIVDTMQGDTLVIDAVSLLQMFHNLEMYDLVLLGETVTVRREKSVEHFSEDKVNDSPGITDLSLQPQSIRELVNALYSYTDREKIKLHVDLISIEPEIDLDSITGDFSWRIPPFRTGLKDIVALHKVKLHWNGIEHTVKIDVHCYADMYIARRNLLKGDQLRQSQFSVSNVDISAFRDMETLVLDIHDVIGTRFQKTVRNGEALRWTLLERTPLVEKGERIPFRYDNGTLLVEISCTAVNSGFENDKIEIKLDNGTRTFGVVRQARGMYYVEVL
jgi:flagella basal body P-ring formation protein FlgA